MSDFVWHETGWEALTGPRGPVDRDLELRAAGVETAAKSLLNRVGTGRLYRKSHPSRLHVASSPGEAPAFDLGKLHDSVRSGPGVDAEGIYADTGTDLDYGLFLEMGTSKMEPRPWLRPALDVGADGF